MIFSGSCTALITPFTADGVDYDALGRLIDRQIEGGADAVLVAGTTGEPPTMTREEKHEVMRFAVRETAGRVPLILGTGGNNTAAAVEETVFAERVGADAALVVTPYYNKCTQGGLVAHYRAVCEAVRLPVIAYNVPGRTGVNIAPETFARLTEIVNLNGLKEASGNIDQIIAMARLATERCPLYCGDDALAYTMFGLGAKGVISVVGNIVPSAVAELARRCLEGRWEEGRRLAFRLYPLAKAMFCEVNPIPVKTAAALLGLCSDRLRLPLTPLEDQHLELLKRAMRDFGLEV